jgi:hypothetical protein
MTPEQADLMVAAMERNADAILWLGVAIVCAALFRVILR